MSSRFQQRRWFDGDRAASLPIALVRAARWNFAVIGLPLIGMVVERLWRSTALARLQSGVPLSTASALTPLWTMVVVLGIAPCSMFAIVLGVRWRLSSLRRRAQRAEGAVCESCLYDLRGLEPEGRCPECGTAYRIGELKRLWGPPALPRP